MPIAAASPAAPRPSDGPLTKLIFLFFALVACIQVIKPLGLPGLKYRRDAWKLALVGFILSAIVVGFVLTN